MAKAYCKWPVIVTIIVVSLIVLSVVMCVARCICCGAECACCCFRCCAGCCGSGRGSKKHKRIDSHPTSAYPPAYPPTYPAAYPPPTMDARSLNDQYQSHPAPAISPINNYRAPAPAPEPERPQFATFETPSKPINEDALPAMPEWSAAKSTRVEEEVIPEKRGDMEMDRFDNGSMAGTTAVGAMGARRSPGPGRSPIQRSPTGDDYGFPQGYQNGAMAPGPYGAQYGQQQDQYRGVSPAQSLSPVNGMGAGYAQNQQYGRSSPAQGYNQEQQYNRPPQGRSPIPQQSNVYGYGPSDVSHEDDTPSYGQQPNNNYAPVPGRSHTPGYAEDRSHTPGYAPSSAYSQSNYAPTESTRYEPSIAYPGQQPYESAEAAAYPGQQPYQAFTPAPAQLQQSAVIPRRPVDGSWKEV
jgi:hypothetical protein